MRALLLSTALVLVPGCKSGVLQDVQDAMRSLAPTVRLSSVTPTKLSWTGVDADVTLTLDNPNAVRVGVASFDWQIEVGEQPFLSGAQPEGLQIEPQATSDILLPMSLGFSEAAAMVADLRTRTDIPIGVTGNVAFRTPFGPVAVPLDFEATLPMLHVPKIQVDGLRVGQIDILRGRAEVEVLLRMSHRFAETTAFTDVDYALTMDDRRIVDGTLAQLAAVPPGEEVEVAVPIGLNLLEVGTVILGQIQDARRVQLGFDAGLTVQTPVGPLPLQIDQTALVPISRK